MTNLYHILYKTPALEHEEMPVSIEWMAEQLVKSGRLRIDAHDKINFARFYLPYQGVSMMFSLRELTDPELVPFTEKIISTVLRRRYGRNNINPLVKQEINRLKHEVQKYQPVSYELEMKLARIVVQSSHPSVILLLLLEKTEIFISYAYTIGDVLDIISWQEAGSNSGMQSTDGRICAIYISAAGDPFAPTEPDSIYGDGFPALARMMVIGGQEIGHYSDIIRDSFGRQISRHSADLGARRAKENVRLGRLQDISQINVLRQNFERAGLINLVELERHLKFYRKHKRKGWVVLVAAIKTFFWRKRLLSHIRRQSLTFAADWHQERYIASKILAMLDDMQFNLTPKADVYSREDKVEEEAIACVEALARVPQQVNKWGHSLVKLVWPSLYLIYYNEVIPACKKTYEDLSGQKYNLHWRKPSASIFYKIKKLFRKQPKHYAIWNY